MSAFNLAAVATRTARALSSTELVAWLRHMWLDLDIHDVRTDAGVIALRVDRVAVRIVVIGEPLRPEDMGPAMRENWLFPEAPDAVAAHTGNVVVTVGWPIDESPVTANLRLAQLTAAVCAHVDAAFVWWRSAQTLHAPENVLQTAKDMSNDKLPVLLWVGFSFETDKHGYISVQTRGLDAFGLLELEVEDSRQTPEVILQLMVEFAQRRLRRGPSTVEVDSYDKADGTRVQVTRGTSMYNESEAVWLLNI